MQKGTINVQAENIFPIIKQFLYSDQEIFLRELVSNAVDATNKLRTLANRGEVPDEVGDLTIQVELDKEAKTLTIRDRGVGMTEEEVKKYLNQVAFSSAQEFLEKYKDDANIIGNFGLGFYSAFMVADQVEVRTLSYEKEAQGITWICEGDPSYTLEKNDKSERGTEVILHIGEDSTEFLEEERISQLLNKYCRFLPVPIQFGMRTETLPLADDAPDEAEPETVEVPNIINNPDPLWKKLPGELSDEDYQNFYQELYPYSTPPMFHIHLNIDYPFNLTGVLYFPKLSNNFELQKNKIQLYSNQVYVTDEVKEIVPEFLTLLHGVIDSPDIPLNVSRSYLQSDSNVRKITGYITKKVADKLGELFKKDRAAYEQKWDDLGVFVKYGMISDDKFYDKSKDYVLLKNLSGEYATIEEYKEKVKAEQTDKHDRIVLLYTNDAGAHATYITAAEAKGYDVLEMNQALDNHFMQHLEQKGLGVTFVRVDSATSDQLVQKDEQHESVLSDEQQEKVKTLFTSVLGENDSRISMKPLSPSDQPVQITRPEFMRRMQEMQSLQGMDFSSMPDTYEVVVNTNHPLIAQKLLRARSSEKKEQLARHLYDLARLNQNMLKGTALSDFVANSLHFLEEK